MVLITSNSTKDALTQAYKRAGASDEDLEALWERLTVIDLYALRVQKRPRHQRQDLSPTRVAATVVSLAAQAAVPFSRQLVPANVLGYAPPSPPQPWSPVSSLKKKPRRYSAPGVLSRAEDV